MSDTGSSVKLRPKKLATGGSFKPGQSGNPSGRKKIPADVIEAARAQTLPAIEALVRGLGDPKRYIDAANSLLDRGWGKAVQAVSGPEGGALEIVIRRIGEE